MKRHTSTPKPKICFVHIPKCGGAALHHAIANLDRWPINRRQRNILFDAPASVRSAEASDLSLLSHRQEVLRYILARNQSRYISGHFGINEQTLNHFTENWHFITILRDPVKRWISHYYYNRDNPDSRHPTAAHFRITDNLSDFVNSDRGRALGSLYATHLAVGDQSGSTGVQHAIDNLKRFSLVGVLENQPAFSEKFEQKFGYRLRLKTINKSPTNRSKQESELTEELIHQIKLICAPDLEIYTQAKLLAEADKLQTHPL